MDPEGYTDTTYGEVRLVPGQGYRAYYPKTLPPVVELATATVTCLADAEAALGRLAGTGRLLPNPHLLIRPYLLREALASARIEGTQASLLGVLEAEADEAEYTPDIEEVLNYVAAMEQGLARLDSLPFSLRLIRDMHAILLRGVRGRERLPGEFRTSQNWIGPPGSTIKTALLVPPPPDELSHLLSDWERYVHENRSVSVLVQSGLLHYQIETIHPFLDGNGRMGRLLIVFHLVLRQRLPQPLLYLSSYFERHRDTYYAMLQAVRERGDLDRWLRFYLRGVETQAIDAVIRAERLIDLRESYRSRVIESTRGQAISLVDSLFANPIITALRVERLLDVTRPTSLRILDRLRGLGILTETAPGARRQRRFMAAEILNVLEDEDPTSTPDDSRQS
ncbi:MAG: Fic family protein [bacterium]|nr:Fic family protein [bacterium]MDE0287812.1 Fic family protein [bacterium]MDE0438303.1 Fic family protein [bacterium]